MNEKFIVKGLAGKNILKGVIKVNGAKNAALKAMSASVLFRDNVTLKNIPDIEDIHRMADLLKDLGGNIKKQGAHTYIIATNSKGNTKLTPIISKCMRASIVLTGPILSRFGHVEFPHPGGCVIGERPIDIFIDGFKKMGASAKRRGETYTISATSKKLHGAEIFLKTQSVTATETFMMAAVLARGTTMIKNAATEPEIKDLADFLVRSGAHIIGAGTNTIIVKGGALLNSKGNIYTTMPDRIEAGSFLVLGALAGRKVEVSNCRPKDIEAVIETLRSAGVRLEVKKKSITVRGARKLNAVNIKTHEYPGFPTDLQAPMTVLLTQAEGESLVFETIFEGRLNYTESLSSMGAKIKMMDPHRVIVHGPTFLHGKKLESPDLRAGLAFVISAIVAKGTSVIHNVYNIDRGYERIEERLKAVGVEIERVKE